MESIRLQANLLHLRLGNGDPVGVAASVQREREIQVGLHVFRCEAVPLPDEIKSNSTDWVSNTSLKVGQAVDYCAFRTSRDGTTVPIAVQWGLEGRSEQGIVGIAPMNSQRVSLTGRGKGVVRLFVRDDQGNMLHFFNVAVN